MSRNLITLSLLSLHLLACGGTAVMKEESGSSSDEPAANHESNGGKQELVAQLITIISSRDMGNIPAGREYTILVIDGPNWRFEPLPRNFEIPVQTRLGCPFEDRPCYRGWVRIIGRVDRKVHQALRTLDSITLGFPPLNGLCYNHKGQCLFVYAGSTIISAPMNPNIHDLCYVPTDGERGYRCSHESNEYYLGWDNCPPGKTCISRQAHVVDYGIPNGHDKLLFFVLTSEQPPTP